MNSRKLAAPPQNADHVFTPLVQREEYQTALRPLEELERAYAERERQREKLLARARGQRTKRSISDRAADLVAGGKIDPVGINDQLEALDSELGILRQAIGEKSAILNRVADELSYPENLALKPAYASAMADGFEAMAAMLAAFRRAASLPATLVRAGYKPSSMVMPNILPPAIVALGDVNDGWSQAWSFRRALEEMRII